MPTGNQHNTLPAREDHTAQPESAKPHPLIHLKPLALPDSVTCALNPRRHHPALIDAGFAERQAPIPWWGGRTLRFRFPPR